MLADVETKLAEAREIRACAAINEAKARKAEIAADAAEFELKKKKLRTVLLTMKAMIPPNAEQPTLMLGEQIRGMRLALESSEEATG